MSLFDDLFENQQRHRNASPQDHVYGRRDNHDDRHYERHGEHDSRYSHSRDRDDFSHIGSLVQKLIHNKTLLVLVGVLLVVALGLFIAALVFLWPLVPKLLGYLDINGLKSLLEQGMAIFEKVSSIGGK